MWHCRILLCTVSFAITHMTTVTTWVRLCGMLRTTPRRPQHSERGADTVGVCAVWLSARGRASHEERRIAATATFVAREVRCRCRCRRSFQAYSIGQARLHSTRLSVHICAGLSVDRLGRRRHIDRACSGWGIMDSRCGVVDLTGVCDRQPMPYAWDWARLVLFRKVANALALKKLCLDMCLDMSLGMCLDMCLGRFGSSDL